MQADNYSEFKDPTHLFYDNKSVAEFNHTKLVQLDAPMWSIPVAKHLQLSLMKQGVCIQ